MLRGIPVLALACILPLAAESGGDYTVRVAASLWLANQQVSGQQGFDPSAADWENGESALMLDAGVRLPLLFDVYAGYYSWGTDGTASSEVSYSDLYLELGYGLDIDRVGVSLGLASHFIGADIDNGSNATDDSTPVLCLAARAFFQPLESWNVEARLHAVSVALDSDSDLGVLDWQLSVAWYPTAMVGVQLGYRSLSYSDVDVNELSANGTMDADLAGPFLGVLAQW